MTILGCEVPRIYTPPLRELTPDTTDGFACIAFAEEMLNLKLFPWQKWALIHALELNPDFTYRFRIVIIELARQNGKTLIMIVLALWHLYCKGSRTIIATAQDLAKAEDAWAAAVEWAQSDEELAECIQKITLAHPKILAILNPQIDKICEYRVASASRRGGRGFSCSLCLLDELREHQTWDSWGAVINTMNARPRAQAWAFSNAGDSLSVVLRYLRTSAHKALGWPDGDGDADLLGESEVDLIDVDQSEDVIGWFEWSAAPNAKRSDHLAWAQSNPSLNHIEVIPDCITERALAAGLRTMPGWQFDAEVMCRFVALSDGGPFPAGSWEATTDNDAEPEGPRRPGETRNVVCVEVSTTRNAAVIVKAGLDIDAEPVVGVLESRPGTDWLVGWLLANKASYCNVVVRSGSGTTTISLLDDFTAARLPVIEWSGSEVGAAFGQLFDRVSERTVRHLTHSGLDAAATSAVTRPQPGGGFVVDLNKSPTDVAPLYAVAGACWGLQHLTGGPSMYSDAGGGRAVLVI
jgi:hypothetical protein